MRAGMGGKQPHSGTLCPIAVSQQEMKQAVARRVFDEIFNQGSSGRG